MSTYIIAEAGVNHDGNIEIAKTMIDAAKESGADCIKFQTFKSENLVTKNASKAIYQIVNTKKEENQLEMLKKLELSFEEFKELNDYCNKKDIAFLSTAFDFESIEFLETLDMKQWKIPSGEITNLPYMIKIAKLGKPIILSTGMCTLDEVRVAKNILQANGANDISILHCTTEYPTAYTDINLKAITTISKEFNVPVGYSDHSIGIEVPVAAVAMGAVIIEKHFTLDKNMAGPDHRASIDCAELKAMVRAIRNVELAFGTEQKMPMESEIKNKEVARKSIVAKRKIIHGEIFTENNLTVKRPGIGISPMKWFEVIGQRAIRDFEEDELIEL